jgi:hypothetical protein
MQIAGVHAPVTRGLPRRYIGPQVDEWHDGDQRRELIRRRELYVIDVASC